MIWIRRGEETGVTAKPKPFRPVTSPCAGSGALAELARLWDQAERHMARKGPRLTQALLARTAKVPPATVNAWATGTALPRDAIDLEKVGTVLARWAGEDPPPLQRWEQLLEADQDTRTGRSLQSGRVGQLITELSDPFALEVHRPVTVDPPGVELPLLPPYVARPHDTDLGRTVARAASGHSELVVLVGGSSTGKTRACWEAIHRLPAGWRVWHPFDPTRPEALLTELPQVGPQTVVWLNETQLYLDTPGDTGERVAAALRTLLTNPRHRPLLVLGTLWPGHWDTLTRPGNVHPQAARLLEGTSVPVPDAFTGTALQDLAHAAVSDPRLAAASAETRDGRVIQYLAGVPELLARYHHAEPPAKALIHAAMDARRLGHRIALPHAFLETAAAAYLTDTEWDAAGDDWLEKALAYTAAPCHGVPGPLTRIRPRPGQPPDTILDTSQQAGPVYRLTDYLDQHGRRQRSDQYPPPGFWIAAARHADPTDQATLADAAHDRGLYRDAAQLRKNAAVHGNLSAGRGLVTDLHCLNPADDRPACWVVTHAALDDPAAVAVLLYTLRKADADQQVAALASRAAAHVALDHSRGVAWLLDSLREAGADQQATALASRAAAHVTLDDPDAVAWLLHGLRKAAADQQVTALLDRDPATHVTLDHPRGVAELLHGLRKAAADQQVTALLDRDPATHVTLDHWRAVTMLLYTLRKADAHQQVAALASRAAAHVALDHPDAVAELLHGLRAVGAHQQVKTLLDRDPAAHVALDHPGALAELLDNLERVGADQQVNALLDRDPATQVALDDPGAVADLLDSLREADADQQVAALASRAAAHVALDHPDAVAWLLDSLREADADQQVTALASRAAAHVALDHPDAVAELLRNLREAGADQQVTALASRAAAHVALDHPDAVAELLHGLRAVGAHQQVKTLLDRDPATHVALDHPDAVARLLDSLREAGADQQVNALLNRDPATHVILNDADTVRLLLNSVRRARADQQVAILSRRLPAGGDVQPFRDAAANRIYVQVRL